jgi:hypothetical protein
MSKGELDTALEASARSPEAVALFNSVLVAELLAHACWENRQSGGNGLAWPEIFTVLPIALHPPTRDSLPNDRRITLARWAVKNQALVAGMEFRLASSAENTRRGLRRGIRNGQLLLAGGRLASASKPAQLNKAWPAEIRESIRAAQICGRWYSNIETVMAFELLGLGG